MAEGIRFARRDLLQSLESYFPSSSIKLGNIIVLLFCAIVVPMNTILLSKKLKKMSSCPKKVIHLKQRQRC